MRQYFFSQTFQYIKRFSIGKHSFHFQFPNSKTHEFSVKIQFLKAKMLYYIITTDVYGMITVHIFSYQKYTFIINYSLK